MPRPIIGTPSNQVSILLGRIMPRIGSVRYCRSTVIFSRGGIPGCLALADQRRSLVGNRQIGQAKLHPLLTLPAVETEAAGGMDELAAILLNGAAERLIH